MQIGLDKRRSIYDKLSFTDDEWEIKTLSSALKTFLRFFFFFFFLTCCNANHN
ncbi:unnamed protein product [Brugia timori]|uniref:Uncharacterized protein n=1 Tax=Brugia timori TaxID=42155 RepID=A0A3P7WUM0_9BILA|nr:unnamed protein product [Brugia timori]